MFRRNETTPIRVRIGSLRRPFGLFGLVALALFAGALSTAHAQVGRAAMRQASATEQARVQASAREIVNDMFARLCPGRCEMIQLDVRMATPQALGTVEPGFEDQAPRSYRARVQSLRVDILLDSALPAAFRQNIPRMLRYRMTELAETIDIRTESLAFPEPQLEPTPPAMPEQPRVIRYAPPPPMPAAQPAPLPVAEPVAAAAEEEPVVETGAGVWPWIAALVLVAIALALFAAYWLGSSRQQRREKAASSVDSARQTEENERLLWLERELSEVLAVKRTISNAALRRWMLEDANAVAEFVKNFGPSSIRDLRSEDELAPALSRIGSHLVAHPKRAPIQERTRLYEEARARFFQAELEESRLAGWDFLEGVSSIQLKHVLDTCSPIERTLVMSELSAPVRAMLAESLSEAERFTLALHAADAAQLSADKRRQLRARIRAEVESVRAQVGQASDGREIVTELLRVASASEQLGLARQIMREQPRLAQAVFERTVLEPAIATLPEGVFADASSQLSIEELVSYLRGTELAVRESLLGQIPARLRNAIEPELELAMPVTRARFHSARNALSERLVEVLRREGHSPLGFNQTAVGSGIIDVRKEAAE